MNGAVLDGDVPVVRVNPSHIVVANPGVSVLVNDSSYVAGVGCRLGTTAEEILSAIAAACAAAGISQDEITMYANDGEEVS